MSDDTNLPWWLRGGESSSEPPREAPYGGGEERVPPPPPPPRRDDSAWLRDSGDPFAPPLHPGYSDASIPYSDSVIDAGPRESLSGWSEPLPSSSPPPRGRQPMSPVQPPPGRRPPAPASKGKGGGNGLVRALGVLFVILLLVTGGIAIARAATGGNGINLGNIIPPTATPTGFARSAKITFTRTTQSIAAPSSTLVAATDGSGQIKATVQTASVTGAASSAITASYQPAQQVIFTLQVHNSNSVAQTSLGGMTISAQTSGVQCTLEGSVNVPANGTAQQKCDEPGKTEPAANWNYTDPSTKLNYTGSSPAGGNAAYYYVPTNCGDPGPANAAAQAAMTGQLGVPPGSVVIFGPKYQTDPSSLSCSPAAGTQQSSSFTYTQKINGTGSQTIFALSDAQQYQTNQIKTKIPTGYALISSQVCPDGPKVGNDATATHATITCPASATVGWDWKPADLAQLASGVAGASVDTAKLQLNGTKGVVAGSVQIALTDGSEMPQDPSAITFAVTP